MNNKDFAVSINRFFYFANNYDCVKITFPSVHSGSRTEYQPEFFKAFEPHLVEHLLGKFEYFYGKCNRRSGAALIEFYAELDGNNRARLLKYINENYNENATWGLALADLED